MQRINSVGGKKAGNWWWYWVQWLCQWRHKRMWHKGGVIMGNLLQFVANKTADCCSWLLPELVPVVGQSKQSFSNKIIRKGRLLLPWHSLNVTALCLTPSPPLVRWLETQQGKAMLRNTESYCHTGMVQWPFYALANTQHAVFHLLAIGDSLTTTAYSNISLQSCKSEALHLRPCWDFTMTVTTMPCHITKLS